MDSRAIDRPNETRSHKRCICPDSKPSILHDELHRKKDSEWPLPEKQSLYNKDIFPSAAIIVTTLWNFYKLLLFGGMKWR